jgi:hypothetical protein
MQHIYPFFELGDINDPMLDRGVNAKLDDTRTNRRKRLPIGWLETALHFAKLESGPSPGILREAPKIRRVSRIIRICSAA